MVGVARHPDILWGWRHSELGSRLFCELCPAWHITLGRRARQSPSPGVSMLGYGEPCGGRAFWEMPDLCQKLHRLTRGS